MFIICLVIEMDVSDELLWSSKDWDPSYLTDIVTQDFYDFSELWNCGNVSDQVLVKDVTFIEHFVHSFIFSLRFHEPISLFSSDRHD